MQEERCALSQHPRSPLGVLIQNKEKNTLISLILAGIRADKHHYHTFPCHGFDTVVAEDS